MNCQTYIAALLLISSATATATATAFAATDAVDAAKATAAKEVAAKNAPTAESSSSDWVGQLGLGVGIGVNFLGADDISDASVINGRIHVNNSEKNKVQLWLESHYLFGGDYSQWACKKTPCKVKDAETQEIRLLNKGDIYFRNRRFYHGPFFAVQVSDGDSLLQGAALGYMISLRRVGTPSATGEVARHFNLGIAASTSKIKTLGSGQTDGAEISGGSQITYSTKSETGVLLLFSVGVF